MSSIRVVKVGGSLLDWPELPQALDAWLNEQSSAVSVLIAGGGQLVDSIREGSRNFSLDDSAAHWRAIDAMSMNAQILHRLLMDSKLISNYGELQLEIESGCGERIVFDANQFLRNHEAERPGCVLPHDWSATSDSIAARLAEVLSANELVLLKSTNPVAETTNALADRGFVDRYFPAFDRCHFRRRYVNLRQATKCPAMEKVDPLVHGRNR